MTEDDVQQQYWDRLYESLRTVLSARGIESAFGDGDYWLVDDNWGEKLHKVCIFNIAYLTPELISQVQKVLSSSPEKGWGVIFSIDVKNQGEPVPMVSSIGITVYEDRIVEDWDKTKLRTLYGSKFRW